MTYHTPVSREFVRPLGLFVARLGNAGLWAGGLLSLPALVFIALLLDDRPKLLEWLLHNWREVLLGISLFAGWGALAGAALAVPLALLAWLRPLTLQDGQAQRWLTWLIWLTGGAVLALSGLIMVLSFNPLQWDGIGASLSLLLIGVAAPLLALRAMRRALAAWNARAELPARPQDLRRQIMALGLRLSGQALLGAALGALVLLALGLLAGVVSDWLATLISIGLAMGLLALLAAFGATLVGSIWRWWPPFPPTLAAWRALLARLLGAYMLLSGWVPAATIGTAAGPALLAAGGVWLIGLGFGGWAAWRWRQFLEL